MQEPRGGVLTKSFAEPATTLAPKGRNPAKAARSYEDASARPLPVLERGKTARPRGTQTSRFEAGKSISGYSTMDYYGRFPRLTSRSRGPAAAWLPCDRHC